MVFNTLTVGAAVTPSVIETYFSHYLNRAPLRHKPTAHISYHEGLRLIREFLDYSSKHSVEDLQSFTGQWVPVPHWIRHSNVHISSDFLDRAAQLVQAQLGPRGLDLVGGKTWWQWRQADSPLTAEWIEMKKDYNERARTGEACQRVMLYVHGGAYYFGSVDEHRYQMQRHARKLKARVLTPKYRLAPQYPFPCGLYDCLAAYLYLLSLYDPSQILFAGDSAGAGMVVSMLVILRDQGQPLPAGTILLSPWLDLTHSFPSVAGDGAGDYIPPHGFHHRPSMAWPPVPSSAASSAQPNALRPDDVVQLPATAGLDMNQHGSRTSGSEDVDGDASKPSPSPSRFGESLSIDLDGRRVELTEQIQLYAPNNLLSHPLVSPVMQPSLGGLPPMLIQTGGAELLKDEQIYFAHKAANPTMYPSNDTIMGEFDPHREALEKWPPTDVQLQLWEDLCHVPHTLSFTRPAKYMYRSVAQFAAWALAHAQHQSINIQNDDAISFISSGGEEDDDDDGGSSAGEGTSAKRKHKERLPMSVGKAGDPLPHFKDHMIRQRVTRHGVIYPLAPVSEIASLALDPESIGVPKSGPVRKWLAAHSANEQKFTSERKKTDKKRAKELAAGYDPIPGERPPPTAIVNRRRNGAVPEEKKRGRSWGLAMWSGWGSSHDEQTLQREQKTERNALRKAGAASALDLNASQRQLAPPEENGSRRRASSSGAIASRLSNRSADSQRGVRDGKDTNAPTILEPHEQQVADEGQADEVPDDSLVGDQRTTRPMSDSANFPIPIEDVVQKYRPERQSADAPIVLIPTMSMTSPSSEKISGTDHTYLSPTGNRPHNGVQAYPFKLKEYGDRAASTLTLDSMVPAAQLDTGASTPHSELMGDTPGPVELPGTSDGMEEQWNRRFGVQVVPSSGGDQSSAPTSVADAYSGDHGAHHVPTQAGTGRNSPIPPIRTTDLSKDEIPITPVDSSTPVTPFKVRNQVFDNRTSMLGSIGADGMPNAYHAFLADESQQSNYPSRGATPEAGEGMKSAAFKVRHTIYQPDITLGISQLTNHSNIPEHSPLNTEDAKILNRRSKRESGVLGLQMNDQRIIGEQPRDRPLSYHAPATTNIIIPKPEFERPNARATNDDKDDRPPTPPPKDDSYVPSPPRAVGQKSGSANDLQEGGILNRVDSRPPAIGTLDFETDFADRPPFETFVTAREGRELRST